MKPPALIGLEDDLSDASSLFSDQCCQESHDIEYISKVVENHSRSVKEQQDALNKMILASEKYLNIDEKDSVISQVKAYNS